MAGIEGGRKIQLGAESAPGTPVAATTIWRGKGVPEDQRMVQFIDEDIGYVSGVDRTITTRLLAKFTFDPTPATFEQPYIFAAGIKNVVAGVADGAGSGRKYVYPMPTVAPNTNVIKTYTLEGGDNQQCEEMEYAFVESFKLTGKPGEAVLWSAEWTGRQLTPTTWTTGLSLPSVESILFSRGKLFIDDVSGTIGNTQKSGTFLGMELAVKTGWQIVETGDGNLYFYTIKHTREDMEVVLNLTFEHDGTATAEKANWRSETARLIRLQWEGSSLATPGTNFSKKTARIDLCGKWEKFEKLGSQKGNDVIAGVFRARFNSTANLFAEFTWVNELTSLP